jgi:hypothetical protein
METLVPSLNSYDDQAISNGGDPNRRMSLYHLYFTLTQKLRLQWLMQTRPHPASTSAPPLRIAPRDLAGALHDAAVERPATTDHLLWISVSAWRSHKTELTPATANHCGWALRVSGTICLTSAIKEDKRRPLH